MECSQELQGRKTGPVGVTATWLCTSCRDNRHSHVSHKTLYLNNDGMHDGGKEKGGKQGDHGAILWGSPTFLGRGSRFVPHSLSVTCAGFNHYSLIS